MQKQTRVATNPASYPPRFLLLTYQPEEDYSEPDFKPEKSNTIAMFNRAMAERKPLEVEYIAPKRKRRAKSDGLVLNNFSATYCLTTDAARYNRPIVSAQKKGERIIRDMNKLRERHGASDKHEVEYTQFTKDITKETWEQHPEDPRKTIHFSWDARQILDEYYPRIRKVELVRVENWAKLTIRRIAA